MRSVRACLVWIGCFAICGAGACGPKAAPALPTTSPAQVQEPAGVPFLCVNPKCPGRMRMFAVPRRRVGRDVLDGAAPLTCPRCDQMAAVVAVKCPHCGSWNPMTLDDCPKCGKGRN